MQLTAWPISARDAKPLHYDGGNPDLFLWGVIDGIGPLLPARTDGSNLAPELLDPYVFAQFVTGLKGGYTVNGTPFNGNWRLLPAATRMAGRLGAQALEAELAQSEAALKDYDTALLDSYDNSDGMALVRALPGEEQAQLGWLLDQRFDALVKEGACTYGTSWQAQRGADQLLAALCDWLVDAFPRDILADAQAVSDRFRATHDWAWEAVENYALEHTAYHVGADVYHLLTAHNLRYAGPLPGVLGPAQNGVMTTRFQVDQGRPLLMLWFSDGKIIVDEASLTEIGRVPNPQGAKTGDGMSMSQAASLSYDPKTYLTRRASRFNPFAKFIKPQLH